MLKYNSYLEINKFDPRHYINVIKKSNNERFEDLDCYLWLELFDTNKSLTEIINNLDVDYSFNKTEDSANRVLTYHLDPSGEYNDVREKISHMIVDKIEFLQSIYNLNEKQIFDVFKASKFKYVSSIHNFINNPEAKIYAKNLGETPNIKEPSLSGDDNYI